MYNKLIEIEILRMKIHYKIFKLLKKLLKNIIEYKKIQKFNISLCFRNEELYEIFKSDIEENFQNNILFVYIK